MRGFFHAFLPVARPTKFATVFGASSGKSRAVNDPFVVVKIAYVPGGVPAGSVGAGVAAAVVPRAAGVAGFAAGVAGFAGGVAGFAVVGGGVPRLAGGVGVWAASGETASARAISEAEMMRCMP